MESGAETPTTIPPPTSAPLSVASPLLERLTIFAIIFIVIALAFLVAWPWLPRSEPQIEARNRYQPLYHGYASTNVTLDAEGFPIAWTPIISARSRL